MGSGDAALKIPSDLPLMLVTGTGDPKRRFGWYAYNDTPARPKIFVNVYGDNHMAPAHGAPVNTMMAHFLGCYLIPNRIRAKSFTEILMTRCAKQFPCTTVIFSELDL